MPIVDALQKTYDATVDFVADFRQETEVKTLGRSLKASGKLSFKRPGKMLWNYETPKGQFVLADGKHLFFYQPEQNQVIKSPLKNAFRGDIPLSFLLGLGNLKKDFNATLKATRRKPKYPAPRAQGRSRRLQRNSRRRQQNFVGHPLGQRARCRQQSDHPALFRHAQRRRHQRLAVSGANPQRRRCRRTRPMTTKQKFSIVSLGCARNLVDSEVMAGLLQKNNYEIVTRARLTPMSSWSTPAALSAPPRKNPSIPLSRWAASRNPAN